VDDPTPAPWATVQVRLVGKDTRNDAVERLDALGALLAAEAMVGGVERRDAGTLVGAARPELWVYTTPPGIEGVQLRVAALAHMLSLTLETAVEVHHDDDWRESWKRFYPPQVFGDRSLLLRPSWVERRPDDPKREVVIDPGRAFGTGLHESTRLCLDRLCALEATGFHPETILDLGCGSGILGLAAARLFPEARLWAFDLDPEAVHTTEENVRFNGLGERISPSVGTIDDVNAPPLALVIANIRPEVLIPSAPAIRTRVAAGGRVLLSGILVEEAAEVEAAYVNEGLVALTSAPQVMGEWQAVELRSP